MNKRDRHTHTEKGRGRERDEETKDHENPGGTKDVALLGMRPGRNERKKKDEINK